MNASSIVFLVRQYEDEQCAMDVFVEDRTLCIQFVRFLRPFSDTVSRSRSREVDSSSIAILSSDRRWPLKPRPKCLQRFHVSCIDPPLHMRERSKTRAQSRSLSYKQRFSSQRILGWRVAACCCRVPQVQSRDTRYRVLELSP